jgi:hypothetical protein
MSPSVWDVRLVPKEDIVTTGLSQAFHDPDQAGTCAIRRPACSRGNSAKRWSRSLNQLLRVVVPVISSAEDDET